MGRKVEEIMKNPDYFLTKLTKIVTPILGLYKLFKRKGMCSCKATAKVMFYFSHKNSYSIKQQFGKEVNL